jgi:MSHA biogenesis protein MshQ
MNKTVSILKKISLTLIMLVLTKVGYSASFTAVSSGDFSNNATWAGSVAPASLVLIDQIFIPVGIDVNLDNDLSINALAAQLDVNGTLTTNNNSSLTINAGVLSGTGSIVVNTLSINVSPLLSFTGDITANTLNSTTGFQSAATIAVVQVLNLTAGTLSLVSGGSLTMISNGTITVAGGLLSVGVGGALDLSNSYNVNYTSGTVLAGVELNGTGLQTVTINVGAGNTVTLTDDLTVPGTLSLTSGTLVLNSNDLAINGAVAATGAGTVLSTALSNISINTSTGNVGSLNFSGFTSTVNSLTVNVANGNEATIGGNLTVAGPLQLNSGTLNFSNTNLTLNGGITVTGTLSGNL